MDVTLEFSLHDDDIFRGTHLVIPESLHPQTLNDLHTHLQEMVRIKALARKYC